MIIEKVIVTIFTAIVFPVLLYGIYLIMRKRMDTDEPYGSEDW